jgi:hypothetical protein
MKLAFHWPALVLIYLPPSYNPDRLPRPNDFAPTRNERILWHPS